MAKFPYENIKATSNQLFLTATVFQLWLHHHLVNKLLKYLSKIDSHTIHHTRSEYTSMKNVLFTSSPGDTNKAGLDPNIWEPLGYLIVSYLLLLGPNEQSSTLHCENHNILLIKTNLYNFCSLLLILPQTVRELGGKTGH